MKDSRVIHSTTKGRFVILSLSCGHSVREALAWYERHRENWNRRIHCPQCKGYK